MPSPRKSTPTLLSAFSGLGGLDLGFKRAGFRIVGSIEFDPIARASLLANWPKHRLIAPHDVTLVAQRIRPSDIGLKRRELDVLAGGPPCQPFSKAAQWSHKAMKGMRDPRAKCLAGFIQLIERFLPKAVVIENVRGFVAGKRNGVARLKKGLREINKANGTNYRLRKQIVDAAHYGVPQRRSRAIIVALRGGAEFGFPEATTENNPVTAWEALRGLAQPKSAPQRPGHWGELLPSIPEGSNYLWHTRKGGGRSLFGYRTRFWSFLLKLSKREPAWTISAHPGPYTGPFHWKSRPLTITELLRLQSFPASWKVSGSRLDQVRQVGNATPPLLAELVARKVITALHGKAYRSKPTLVITRTRLKVPPAERLGGIPKRFEKHVKQRADHPGTGRGPAPITASDNTERKVGKAA